MNKSQKRFSLDIFKMGYFILFKGKGFIPYLITREQIKKGFAKEKAQYTHIATSGGSQWIVEASPPRIKVIDIRKKYRGKDILIVKYKAKGYRKRYKVAFWSATKTNLPYDWLGVLAFKFKWLFKHQKRFYFCSETCAYALKKEYPRALGFLLPHQTVPANFLDERYFQIVWEGKIPA